MPGLSLVDTTTTLVGRLLRQGTRLISLRPAAKPLHPRGAVLTGTLVRRGSRPSSGVPWLDATGEDEVLVRWSRSAGLPAPLPDVFGLAVRVPAPDGRVGDLLFSSVGRGPLTRFLLVPRRSPGVPLGTLLPYRTAAGPVLLRVEPADGEDLRRLELSWAVGRGPWRPFAEIRLPEAPQSAGDAPLSFDAVLHTVPGLEQYDWVRRVREPSYRAARQRRGE
jgi:hypothetical protein